MLSLDVVGDWKPGQDLKGPCWALRDCCIQPQHERDRIGYGFQGMLRVAVPSAE